LLLLFLFCSCCITDAVVVVVIVAVGVVVDMGAVVGVEEEAIEISTLRIKEMIICVFLFGFEKWWWVGARAHKHNTNILRVFFVRIQTFIFVLFGALFICVFFNHSLLNFKLFF